MRSMTHIASGLGRRSFRYGPHQRDGFPPVVAQDPTDGADFDDACAAGDEDCDLSLRQLRATHAREAAIADHTFADPDDEPAPANGTADTEDEDVPPLGAFCCQNGQGFGYTDASDKGASCYPSAKAEIGGYCDSATTCAPDCNGTWITGFCATSKVEGAEDPCTMSLNGHGTGYTYTGSNSRALQGEACGTEDACGGCNGTWCLYPKEVIY